jgi:hypothetical protein
MFPSRNLENLSKEFDKVLERMQDPKAKKAMKAAFDAAFTELGRNAVKAAAKSSLTKNPLKSRDADTTT